MSTDITARKGMRSFIELIKEIDINPHIQRDRGTLFELLVVAYFENEPMYARLFDKVWKLSDVPAEYKIPKKDTGVDLVARKHETGELVAIQCKFYSEDTIIQKLHIDSFLNEVGKQYYAEGIIITTTDRWSANADDALKFRDKTIARISLADLRESKIDWSSFSFSNPTAVQLQEKKTPRSHQFPAIDAVMEGFKTANRGKLIMAPGMGKTFTSMAIAETELISTAIKESKEEDFLCKCPACQNGHILEKKSNFACNQSCNFSLPKVLLKKKLSVAAIKNLCEKQKTSKIKGFESKVGKKFDAIFELDDQKKIKFNFS